MARECPSKRAYIATEDGGYISTSDVEEDIEDEPASNEDQNGVSLGLDGVGNKKIYFVQRILSTHMEEAEKQQHHTHVLDFICE